MRSVAAIIAMNMKMPIGIFILRIGKSYGALDVLVPIVPSVLKPGRLEFDRLISRLPFDVAQGKLLEMTVVRRCLIL